MNKNIHKILRVIGSLFFFVFTPRLANFFILFINRTYSTWKVNEFKQIGNSFFFEYPLFLHGGRFIRIGDAFSCKQGLKLEAIDFFLDEKFSPEIVIGKNVSIQRNCHIGAINKIVIGNNVMIASNVFISDHSHGEIIKEALELPPAKRKLYSKGPIVIEDNVWLGEGVVILPNITIGENCIVGANSVVTKSLPKNCVVAGNPARMLRSF